MLVAGEQVIDDAGFLSVDGCGDGTDVVDICVHHCGVYVVSDQDG